MATEQRDEPWSHNLPGTPREEWRGDVSRNVVSRSERNKDE
ncbi:MAG: hypothetical protein WCJ47_00165 [Methanomicrobiales archaeon]